MSILTLFNETGKSIRLQRVGDRVWVNLTDMATTSGKSIQDWLSQQSVIEYLECLEIHEEQELRRYAFTLGLDNFTEAFNIFTRIGNAEKARKKSAKQNGMIYIVSNGTAYYKLGFSRNVKERMKSLQTANGKGLKVVKTFSGRIKSEQELHKLLKNFNTTGEWYKKDILEIVTQELIDSLSESNHKDISSCFPLVITSNIGGSPELAGTWVIDEVAIDFAAWCNTSFRVWVSQQIRILMTEGSTSSGTSRSLTN